MNHWARIISELKMTLRGIPFRDWPAMILLWLQLKHLAEALDTLFSAWRSGTLPAAPEPAAIVPEPAPACAPRRSSPTARPYRAPRAPAAPSPLPSHQPSAPRPAHQPQPHRARLPGPHARIPAAHAHLTPIPIRRTT